MKGEETVFVYRRGSEGPCFADDLVLCLVVVEGQRLCQRRDVVGRSAAGRRRVLSSLRQNNFQCVVVASPYVFVCTVYSHIQIGGTVSSRNLHRRARVNLDKTKDTDVPRN